jgi:hypothetical protein
MPSKIGVFLIWFATCQCLQAQTGSVGVVVSLITFAQRMQSRWYQDQSGWFLRRPDGLIIREPVVNPTQLRGMALGGWGPTSITVPWGSSFSSRISARFATASVEIELDFDNQGKLVKEDLSGSNPSVSDEVDIITRAFVNSLNKVHSIYDTKPDDGTDVPVE